MTNFTNEEVLHLGNLARIRLTDDEVGIMKHDLNLILDSIDQISEVSKLDIKPTSHPLPLTNVFREDKPETSLSQADAISAAPKAIDGMFMSPKILGED
jgi:aspartyl-tRNA(Asn)/glutamyl-tRNA(Gln) amidotransferase subunit C